MSQKSPQQGVVPETNQEQLFRQILAESPEADTTQVTISLDDGQVSFRRFGMVRKHFFWDQVPPEIQALIVQGAVIIESWRKQSREMAETEATLTIQQETLTAWEEAVQIVLSHHYGHEDADGETLSFAEVNGKFYIGNADYLPNRLVENPQAAKNIRDIVTKRDQVSQETEDKAQRLAKLEIRVRQLQENATTLLQAASQAFVTQLASKGYRPEKMLLANHPCDVTKTIIVVEFAVDYEIGNFPATMLPPELRVVMKDEIVVNP